MKNIRLFRILIFTSWVFQGSIAESYADRLVLGNLEFLNQGPVQSFVSITDSEVPTSIGVLISQEALRTLPETHQEIHLDLPQSISIFPYDHITLAWYPDPSVFEFRFTLISRAHSEHCRITVPIDSTARAGFSYTFQDGHLSSLSPWVHPDLFYSSTQRIHEITPPTDLKINGFYPKSYSITYDHGLRRYRIALEELEQWGM